MSPTHDPHSLCAFMSLGMLAKVSDKHFALHFQEEVKNVAWRIPGTGEPGGLQSMGLQSQT